MDLSRIFGVFLISFVLTFVNASDERRPVMHLTDDNILTGVLHYLRAT